MRYDNPQYTLSAIEAAQKNDAEPMSERIRFAVHELTHHLIAEHYGLISDGIELGYKAGWPRSAAGLAHYADELKRKYVRKEPITPQEDEAYVHAALSNGYGDEAVFGTEPERRGDDDDIQTATRHMEIKWDYEPDDIDTFVAQSIKQTRRILSDTKMRQALLNAGKYAAQEYWGTGKLMQRDVINEVLNLKGGR